MRVLAFDTSTDWLSVAAGDGVRWRRRDERAGHAASSRIVPAIDEVLAEAGWRLADLDGIAFGAGPGAFTGVRIACAVAQGLALGAGLPLVPVPTLAALAHAAWRERGEARVLACLDARMREVYVGAYAHEGGDWRVALEPSVLKPEDVAAPDAAPWFGAGEGFAAYPALAARLGLAGVDASAVPDAGAIAELAWPALASGRGLAPRDASPLYVRHRIALTIAERDAGQRL
jgi:tRNA threonylcarbamoyladenosine biosynthesis protein TsaB